MLLKFKVLGLISIYFSHVPYIYFVFPIVNKESVNRQVPLGQS